MHNTFERISPQDERFNASIHFCIIHLAVTFFFVKTSKKNIAYAEVVKDVSDVGTGFKISFFLLALFICLCHRYRNWSHSWHSTVHQIEFGRFHLFWFCFRKWRSLLEFLSIISREKRQYFLPTNVILCHVERTSSLVLWQKEQLECESILSFTEKVFTT